MVVDQVGMVQPPHQVQPRKMETQTPRLFQASRFEGETMSDGWKKFWAWFTVMVMVAGAVTCIAMGTVEGLKVLK